MDSQPLLPNVEFLAAPVYLLLLALEALLVRRRRLRGAYQARDTATSLAMGLGNLVEALLFGSLALGLLWLAWEWRLATIPTTWVAGIACFVLDDLRFYWSHRLSHRIRWWWASHVVHHSSEHYNLGTALRQPWISKLSGLVLLRVPLVLVGFHPGLVVFCGSLNLIYQFWIHTEAIDRLPRPFEAIFNTPSHHRVHHATNPRYLDANYAGVLIVWDRLFGSFVAERRDDPVRYGILHPIASFNPLRVAFHEYVALFRDVFRPGLPLLTRLGYLFGPPGWSHDDSRGDTRAVKAAFLAQHPECAGQPGLAL